MLIHDLVSVITPMYNSQRFIADAIRSVVAQTYANWEMIIADDCSTDGSCAIVETFLKQDGRIKLVRLEKNSGVAAARNAALRKAEGRYIAFLDSDDVWMPEKLAAQCELMLKRAAALSYTAYLKEGENESIADGTKFARKITVPDSMTYKQLLRSNRIGCSTAMYDSHMLSKLYMDAAGHEDYILWLSILRKVHEAVGLNEPLTIYRVREKGISRNKFRAAGYQWYIYRQVEHISFMKSIVLFTQYAYSGIKKYYV